MVLAGLDQKDFLAVLKANGYDVLSSKHWDLEGVERIVLGKDGHTFVIRLKSRYDYLDVIRRFKSLEVFIIPEEQKYEYDACKKAYDQDMMLRLSFKAQQELKSRGKSGK